MISVQKYRMTDLSIDIFGKFLEETWNVAVLDLYLKAQCLIDELQVSGFLGM